MIKLFCLLLVCLLVLPGHSTECYSGWREGVAYGKDNNRRGTGKFWIPIPDNCVDNQSECEDGHNCGCLPCQTDRLLCFYKHLEGCSCPANEGFCDLNWKCATCYDDEDTCMENKSADNCACDRCTQFGKTCWFEQNDNC